MSSYRGVGGAGGAWDGGPPGAEAEYATQRPPEPYAPAPHAMPTTDPWTGVSYTQYAAPPNYDYQAYGAPGYSYNYDSSYYQRSDGNYYRKYPDSRTHYPPAQQGDYSYPPRHRSRTRSPVETRGYDRRRRSYKSNSRSVSPYEKRAYSRKRDSSYEEESRLRSRSRSIKSKHTKYSSSEHSSSRSRSSSRSSMRKIRKKKRTSVSTESSGSDRSYKYKKTSKSRGRDHSLTPPLKKRSISRSHNRSRSRETPNDGRLKSRSPRLSERDRLKGKDAKYHSSKELKEKNRQRDESTPPRKFKEEPTTPKGHKKSDRCSVTPPRSYKKSEPAAPSPKNKYKDRRSDRSPKKRRESSLTPPKSYARSRSPSSSRSRSRSSSPRHSKYRRSRTPKSRRTPSSSSHSSTSTRQSRSKSIRRSRRSASKSSRTKSRSKLRSMSKSRSKSRRRSKSRGKDRRSRTPKESKSKSRSPSRSSRSRSSGTPSEDERRGQFTVADRKRYWKLHRSRQEEKERVKSPPKEVKPPPGAVESTNVDDIEYGDPPEVDGPNFAELLPPPEQVPQTASSSKSKSIPIPIKNDGSFLEMFKKMQEATKKAEATEEKKPAIKKPALPFIGKRRGGRVLKTGLVKKAKAIDEQPADNAPKDAWSLYMQEVKKYRETSCEEERKTRPLVK